MELCSEPALKMLLDWLPKLRSDLLKLLIEINNPMLNA